MKECPFREGDEIVYKPSERGRRLGLMTELAKLVPEKRYRIVKIVDNKYVVVEGLEHSATGGLHWTEFSSANET